MSSDLDFFYYIQIIFSKEFKSQIQQISLQFDSEIISVWIQFEALSLRKWTLKETCIYWREFAAYIGQILVYKIQMFSTISYLHCWHQHVELCPAYCYYD